MVCSLIKSAFYKTRECRAASMERCYHPTLHEYDATEIRSIIAAFNKMTSCIKLLGDDHALLMGRCCL